MNFLHLPSDKLDEKQIELLRNGSSGNIATVLAKAVPGLSDSSRTITDYGQTGPVMPSSWSMVFQ